MDSRSKILNALPKAAKRNSLPALPSLRSPGESDLPAFCEVVRNIGGGIVMLKSINELENYITSNFSTTGIMVSAYPGISFENIPEALQPQRRKDLSIVVLKGEFGVAENGAIWITTETIPDRVLPFLCEHLVVVIPKDSIVPTMHEAYEVIGTSNYHFGTFIAGPSKTADIEQSLVLGAHGPKSMTVVLL